MVNEMVADPSMWKDLFYVTTKNGGLCLRLLTERYQACKYNTVAHFYKETNGQKSL
jgi:hypothetical protein